MAKEALRIAMEIDGKRYANAARGLNALAKNYAIAFKDLTPIAKKEMTDVLDSVKAAMRERHGTRWAAGVRLPSGKKTGKLATRSGKGLRGLHRKVTSSPTEVTGSVTVDFPMSVHEKGAIIRKKRKLLAIPLPAALTARGVPKKKGPRDWPNTFVAKSKKGNLLIFQKKGSKIIPLYVLKEKVRIPARLGLGETVKKAAPMFVERVFARAVKRLQTGVIKGG